MKKIFSLLLCFALTFTLVTSVSADQPDATNDKLNQPQDIDVAANNPENIKLAIESIGEVDQENPEATYIFEDGSSIVVSINAVENKLAANPYILNPRLNSQNSINAAASNSEASISISGESTFHTLWTYTLYVEYKSDGTKITWYDNPYDTFTKPFTSLWTLDSSNPLPGTNPNDSKGFRATSNITCSYGIWELRPQTVNAKLALNIKGNGTYSGTAQWID